jgi:hypothetical protein
MKLCLTAIIINLIFVGCAVNNSFWQIIKINLMSSGDINTIQNIGNSTIFIGGAIMKDGKFKMNDSKAFLAISVNRGKTWIKKTNFDCNTIENLDYNANVLLISGVKDNKYLAPCFYRYLIQKNKLQKMEFPGNIEVKRLVKIIDQNIYLFAISSKNSFGSAYLKTTDGGQTWSTFLFSSDNKRDMFNEMCIEGNKMWGIKTHFQNFEDSIHLQSLVSVDMNTMKIIDDIPLGTSVEEKKGHMYISDIKVNDGELFLLGQIKGNNIGYVWRVNRSMKKLGVQDTFKIAQKQLTNKLFLYGKSIIVTYTDISTFFPRETLLYKSLNEKSWKREPFPKLTYPSLSFNNGMLMGIAAGDKIFFKQFQ